MKIKQLFSIVLIAIFGYFSFSCSENDDSGTTAHVKMILVDAPGDYKAVYVDIIDIQVNEQNDEEGWKSLP